MATSTINISLPDTMKSAVEEAIMSEGYGNTSEFFRDLVRNYLKARQEQQLETVLLQRLGNENTEDFDIEKAKKTLTKRLNKRK